MSDLRLTTCPAGTELARGNLLSAAIRRDVADLNRLYLYCALDASLALDPWFALPAPAVLCLAAAPAPVREQVALSPFTLFDLRLPQLAEPAAWWPVAVADALAPPLLASAQAEARRSFGLVALGVARRLAENMPMSPRIAFGVGADVEARLSGLSPSESFGMASWPGLIRPRWARHDRFWCMLVATAAGANAEMLQWAFAAGMCLPAQPDRDAPVVQSLVRKRLRADPPRR